MMNAWDPNLTKYNIQGSPSYLFSGLAVLVKVATPSTGHRNNLVGSGYPINYRVCNSGNQFAKSVMV